jgi:hypothetical protein
MGCSILSLVELIYQVFAFAFFKTSDTIAAEKEEIKRVPTPMSDKKAIVLHPDDDERVVVVEN